MNIVGTPYIEVALYFSQARILFSALN